MLMKVYGIDGFDQYKEPKYIPAAVPHSRMKDIFQVIREGRCVTASSIYEF